MGCDKIKPPEPPKLDPSKLPAGISLPEGQSPEQFAAQASENSLIPDAISGVENLIDKNVKSISEGLNPEAIGEKIGESIAGIANTVTGLVDEAVAGVTGLADSISNMGKKAKQANSPDAIAGSVKSKLPGAGALAEARKKCEEEAMSKAAKLKADMQAKADSAASSLSAAQKKKMSADPKYKEQVMSEIQANVESETLQQVADEAKQVEKKTRTVQDNMQNEKLTVVPASNTVDYNKMESLIFQMVYYQSRMYQTLDSIALSVAAIVQDDAFAGRLQTPPILDLWKVIYGTINFKVYAKLAKGLKTEWETFEVSYSPANGPDDVWDAFDFGSGSEVTFGSHLQFSRAPTYSSLARPAFFDYDGSRKTGQYMLDEYFKMWSGESWMLQDSVNADGPTQDQIDSGRASGTPGVLGIYDLYVDGIRLAGVTTSQKPQSERTPSDEHVIQVGESVGNNNGWLDVYKTYVAGGSWRDQQYTPTTPEQLKQYVYTKQQDEIFRKYSGSSFFDAEQSEAHVYIGVDNNTGNPQQLYNRNFILKAGVNWSNNTITTMEVDGVDDKTKEVIET